MHAIRYLAWYSAAADLAWVLSWEQGFARMKGKRMDLGIVTSVDWSTLFDYLAVIIGAITGALFAVARKLDIVGTVAIGVITAYGGGIIRDMLLNSHGFFFMQHPLLIVACACIAAVVFVFSRSARKLESGLFYADALSMSWFALAGTVKSWNADVGIVLAIVLGTVTAVGGGALRDICTGETPVIFKAGNFYAISAFLGATFFVACESLGAPILVSSIGCVVISFMLTLMSRHFGWHTTHKDE